MLYQLSVSKHSRAQLKGAVSGKHEGTPGAKDRRRVCCTQVAGHRSCGSLPTASAVTAPERHPACPVFACVHWGHLRDGALLGRAEPPPEAPSTTAAPAEFAEEAEAGEPSLFDADVRPFRPKPGVYARGMHAREMAAQQAARLSGTARWGFLRPHSRPRAGADVVWWLLCFLMLQQRLPLAQHKQLHQHLRSGWSLSVHRVSLRQQP